MSYVPTPKQLTKLIGDLKKIPLFEWATRPLGFNFWEIDLTGYHEYYKKYIGMRFEYVFLQSKGNYEIQYRNKKQQAEFIAKLQSRLKNFGALIRHEQQMDMLYHQAWRMAKDLGQRDWTKLSNRQLAKTYKNYHKLYAELIGCISTGILVAEAMAKELNQQLALQAQKLQIKENIDLAVRDLSTPLNLSMTAQEELALLKLAKTKLSPSAIKKHQKIWSYIPAYTQFQPWSEQDIMSRIKSLNKKQVGKRYQELAGHKATAYKRKLEIFKIFKLDKNIQAKAHLLAKYIFWRINDETTIGLITTRRQAFHREIAKRLFISQKQLEYMGREEILKALLRGKINQPIINQRLKSFLQIMTPHGLAVISGRDEKTVLSQLKLSSHQAKLSNKSSFQGTPAQPGLAKGRVRIILDPKDIGKFKRGEILVTPNTTPAYVVAMKMAAAIITEEGGITSHAAIVSRELKVPCVIGVANITKILKDGTMLAVNANNGSIKKL